jgi:hypothetical protein
MSDRVPAKAGVGVMARRGRFTSSEKIVVRGGS